MATRQGGGLSGSIFDVAGLVSALLLAVAMILTAIGIADHAFTALLLGIAGFIPGVLTHVTGITALCGLFGCLGNTPVVQEGLGVLAGRPACCKINI